MFVKLLNFNKFLFERYEEVEGANKAELQLFLTASFLCRLGDFLDFLKSDPLNRFGTTTEDNFSKHMVLQVVFHAAGKFALVFFLFRSITILTPSTACVVHWKILRD